MLFADLFQNTIELHNFVLVGFVLEMIEERLSIDLEIMPA
jgi:hypothetical protein